MDLKPLTKLAKELLYRKKFIITTVLLFLSIILSITVSQIPQEIRQRAQILEEESEEEPEEELIQPPQCMAKNGYCVPASDGCFAGDTEYEPETDYGQLDCPQQTICCGTTEEFSAAITTIAPTAIAALTATAAPPATPTATPATAEPTLLPLAEDVNGDNILSALDYNEIVNCYGATPNTSCDASKKQKTDLNKDGSINGIDINLFLRAASKK